VENCGLQPRSSQTKDYKIGICWFSTKHAVKTGRHRIQILCLSADCLFSELALYKSNVACWSVSSSFHWKLSCSRHDTLNNNHSLTHNYICLYSKATLAHFFKNFHIFFKKLYNATKALAFASYFCKMKVKNLHLSPDGRLIWVVEAWNLNLNSGKCWRRPENIAKSWCRQV
jgi:hypothetical protein